MATKSEDAENLLCFLIPSTDGSMYETTIRRVRETVKNPSTSPVCEINIRIQSAATKWAWDRPVYHSILVCWLRTSRLWIIYVREMEWTLVMLGGRLFGWSSSSAPSSSSSSSSSSVSVSEAPTARVCQTVIQGLNHDKS